MNNEISIAFLCIAITVGNLLWCTITDSEYKIAWQRSWLISLGAVMSYFVLL